MKKLFILACMLAFATTAFAGQAKNAPTASYSGVIEKYDAATKTLTVKRKDKQGEFVITDSSEVLQNKAKADVSASYRKPNPGGDGSRSSWVVSTRCVCCGSRSSMR